MNEQLETKLVEILSDITKATKAAGDFAIEQLPDIAMQYVLYGRVKSVIVTTVLLVIIVALYSLTYYAYKNPWNHSEYYWDRGKKRSESNYVVMIIPAVLATFMLLIALTEFNYLVWFAPKVWLLKELAELVK